MDELRLFERIARKAFLFTEATPDSERVLHPFDERNIHEHLPAKVRQLFDDGHYSQATFEAFKFVDKTIQRLAASKDTGVKLMSTVLNDTSPRVELTPCETESEKNEQKGYQFLFMGSVLAIRNPRGHEYNIDDSPDICLDHLSLASVLLRRLEQSGYDVVR